MNRLERPLDVAVLVNAFPELSETFILNQLIGLRAAGHRVSILALTRRSGPAHAKVTSHDLLPAAQYHGLPPGRRARILKYPAIAARAPRSLLRIARPSTLRRFPAEVLSLRLPYAAARTRPATFDVIHAHFGQNGNLAQALREAGLLRGPLLTSFHGLDATAHPSRWGHRVYEHLFARGEGFTANSRFVRDKLLTLGCPPERMSLLPEGLFVHEFPFRRRTPPPDGRVRFLTVARLVEKKGLRNSIRAFALARQQLPAATYTIVGDGPLRGDLESLSAYLELNGSIAFVGPLPQEQVARTMCEHHVFVLASITTAEGDHEGQGLVLQEAQASGMPVIATDHNGFPDSLVAGVTGYLIPEGDVGALAQRMVALGRAPELWPSIGEAGAAFVRERFEQTALTERLVALYRRCVHQSLTAWAQADPGREDG
jgi:colanic acid/amylovoran biosynthesis glycosyltransferase